MKSKSTVLDQTLENITKYCERHFPDLHTHGEFDAIASHLLQSPSYRVPFLSEDSKREIINYLLADKKISASKKKKNYTVCEKSGSYLPIQGAFDFIYETVPFPPPAKPKFTFIDLFAGIGGFRQAMQSFDGKCVFSSEWDKYAKQTYFRNYGEVPYGDIREIDAKEIPDHDVLCGGFPCQPFSLAGVSKKNSLGRKHGFEDETQGTLFFDVARIISEKRPKAFFLENVKNLLSHDKGKTFKVIEKTLSEIGYVFTFKVVNASAWVPQSRQRIFIVGFDKTKYPNLKPQDIIIPSRPEEGYVYPELNKIIEQNVDEKFTLGPGTWRSLQRHKENHAKKGNGFGYGLHTWPIKDSEVTRTISARYHKDGAEVLIDQPNRERPRRLTVDEAKQLQGYDREKFIFPVSNTQAYKQIGNSVAVPAIKAVAAEIYKLLNSKK